MPGFVVVIPGLLLVIVVMTAVFLLVRRNRRLSSPEARYRRDIRALRTITELRTEPRPTGQLGADGLDTKYAGGAWLA